MTSLCGNAKARSSSDEVIVGAAGATAVENRWLLVAEAKAGVVVEVLRIGKVKEACLVRVAARRALGSMVVRG
jgi:hypothetical protein